jgi:hypothetical protein
MSPRHLTFRFPWLCPILGILLLAVSNCTPPHQTHVDLLEWVVANHTPDTLEVTVRYPLDSARLAPTHAYQLYQAWRLDSAAYEGRGFLRYPLRRLSVHHGQWYQVDTHQSEVNPFLNDAPTVRAGYLDSLGIWMHVEANTLATYTPTGRVARLDRLHGIITYRIAPYKRQVLTTDGALSASSKAIVGLRLTQEAASRTLRPGSSLANLFQQVENLPAKDYNWYQRQLNVGPALQVEK